MSKNWYKVARKSPSYKKKKKKELAFLLNKEGLKRLDGTIWNRYASIPSQEFYPSN